jgi:hypothetical protein
VPYGTPIAYREGNRVTIIIDLPDRGEISQSGRAENLVDPNKWHPLDEEDGMDFKVVLTRRLRRAGRVVFRPLPNGYTSRSLS